MEKLANPNSANALNLRDALMKCKEQIYLRSPFLDAGGKTITGGPGENLWEQVWTGYQMHIWRRDCESNPGPFVLSAREEPLHYLLELKLFWLEKVTCYQGTGDKNIFCEYIILGEVNFGILRGAHEHFGYYFEYHTRS